MLLKGVPDRGSGEARVGPENITKWHPAKSRCVTRSRLYWGYAVDIATNALERITISLGKVREN